MNFIGFHNCAIAGDVLIIAMPSKEINYIIAALQVHTTPNAWCDKWNCGVLIIPITVYSHTIWYRMVCTLHDTPHTFSVGAIEKFALIEASWTPQDSKETYCVYIKVNSILFSALSSLYLFTL